MADTLSYICAAIEYAGQAKHAPPSLRPIYAELATAFANRATAEIQARAWERSLPALTGKIVPSKPAPRGGISL